MLHAITTYFNPVGYRRLHDNIVRFRDTLRKCPLTIIELSFDGRFVFSDSIHVTGVPSKHLMWQKERLLNLAAEQLPGDVDKIAWIDGDVIFANDNWCQIAEAKLDSDPVVQLFESAHHLDSSGRVAKVTPAMHAGSQENPGWPGFAWAARRELFPLYDQHILGGADALMYYAFVGQHRDRKSWRTKGMSEPWFQSYVSSSERMHSITKGKVGFVEGDILHLYHGEKSNRKYMERWSYLYDFAFNPAVDILIGDGGLWEWSSDMKSDMHALVRYYFRERKEDEPSRSVQGRQQGSINGSGVPNVRHNFDAIKAKAAQAAGLARSAGKR